MGCSPQIVATKPESPSLHCFRRRVTFTASAWEPSVTSTACIWKRKSVFDEIYGILWNCTTKLKPFTDFFLMSSDPEMYLIVLSLFPRLLFLDHHLFTSETLNKWNPKKNTKNGVHFRSKKTKQIWNQLGSQKNMPRSLCARAGAQLIHRGICQGHAQLAIDELSTLRSRSDR